jgi:hypothetical protein
MPKRESKWKVGDLLTDKDYPGEGFGILVAINDLRTKEPYIIECDHGTIRYSKKMMKEEIVKVA